MLCVATTFRRALGLGLIASIYPFTAATAQEIPAPGVIPVREIPAPAAIAAREITAPTFPSAPSPEGDTLRPGQYRWYETTTSAAGPVTILVSLPIQRAYVFRGGAMIAVSTVSSGQPGYDTPTGAFTILEKDVDHHSSLYDDAPMPFMQRLTWDGVALHAGQVMAEPASHGCVRLPRAFARRLYGITGIGTRVVVTDETPASTEDALALLSGRAAGTSIASNQ